MIFDLISRRWTRAAAALAALGLGAAAPPPPAPAAQPSPALWKLADEDTTIYLFGTIHLLPEGHSWQTPALKQALASADELVLETVIDEKATEAGKAVVRLGVDKNQPPLTERVPEDKRAHLVERLKAAGLKAGSLDHLETWAAAMTLLATVFRDVGLKSDIGVERSLAALAPGKKISGLETVEQQFGFLDGLSEEGQRALLVSALDDPQAARDGFQDMLQAWTTGDVEGIARTFNSETAMSPELREALMRRRNTAWADWLQRRLDQPGTIMVAVGAGHLAGNDSVQTMLEAKGLTVERVN
jgi:uncharacterized protein